MGARVSSEFRASFLFVILNEVKNLLVKSRTRFLGPLALGMTGFWMRVLIL